MDAAALLLLTLFLSLLFLSSLLLLLLLLLVVFPRLLLLQGGAAPCAGKVYFIANGEPKPIRDLINALLAAAGLPPCKKTVPRFVALGAAAACEQAWLTLQLEGEPWLTRFLVDMMSTAHWYKLGAAQKDLGYTAKVSTEQGLQRLQAALRSEQCC